MVDRSDIKLSNIKLDCPAYGNDIDITNFLYDNTTGQSLITLSRDHDLELGETVKLADIKFQCPPYGTIQRHCCWFLHCNRNLQSQHLHHLVVYP